MRLFDEAHRLHSLEDKAHHVVAAAVALLLVNQRSEKTFSFGVCGGWIGKTELLEDGRDFCAGHGAFSCG